MHPPPVFFDEVQQAPGLLPCVKERIDATKNCTGQYLLTGSQDLLLAESITESLAGRRPYCASFPFPVVRRRAGLTQYQAFLRTLAAPSAQFVNLSELGRDPGVALNTVKAWRSVLEATYHTIACQDAVIRRIEIIGEAGRRISDGSKKEHPELPWQERRKRAADMLEAVGQPRLPLGLRAARPAA
ncbi:MAG: AAA family ATPase [Desulfatiglandales bacterium]